MLKSLIRIGIVSAYITIISMELIIREYLPDFMRDFRAEEMLCAMMTVVVGQRY
jgi:hypothetical protein